MGCHCGPGGIAVEQSRIAAHADPSMGLAGSIDAHQVDLIREVSDMPAALRESDSSSRFHRQSLIPTDSPPW
jgi:hypothetical protein